MPGQDAASSAAARVALPFGTQAATPVLGLNSITAQRLFWRQRFAQALVSALALFLFAATSHSTASGRASVHAAFHDWPRTMVWAWERPEELAFLDAREAGVAFLANTVELRGKGASVRPRMQPLRVSPQARLIAVVRVEARGAALTAEQRKSAVDAVVDASRLPRVGAVQIDFDATASQREFYRAIVRDLRARLPQTPISITALASWCMDDDWMAGLPIDEAVPMLFRMGRDGRSIRARLRAGDDFREPLCRSSAGVSTDEPLPAVPAGRRVYWFAPHPWTHAELHAAEEATR